MLLWLSITYGYRPEQNLQTFPHIFLKRKISKNLLNTAEIINLAKILNKYNLGRFQYCENQ